MCLHLIHLSEPLKCHKKKQIFYLSLWSTRCRKCVVAAVSQHGSIEHVCSCVIAPIGFGGGPEGQPVIDGNDDRVFEEFRGNHHEDHEEATRGQVTPAHLRRSGMKHLLLKLQM